MSLSLLLGCRVSVVRALPGKGGSGACPPASSAFLLCALTRQRAGTVTVIGGLQQLPVEDKKTLLKKLKNAVAGGGNIADDGKLEVQGEHAETVCCPVPWRAICVCVCVCVFVCVFVFVCVCACVCVY